MSGLPSKELSTGIQDKMRTLVISVSFKIGLMAHSHCTGPGMGTMGLCILLCSVHTTQGQGQGMGTGTIGFHTHFLIPGPVPVPIPVPGPVQCE